MDATNAVTEECDVNEVNTCREREMKKMNAAKAVMTLKSWSECE